MDIKVLELAVDLTKTTVEHSAPGMVTAPEAITKFMEVIAKKLHELYRQA